MRKKLVVRCVLGAVLLASGGVSPALADELGVPDSQTADPVVEEPAPTEPAPTEPEPTEPEPTEPAPTPSYAPGMAPGEHGGWVAVNPDGSMASGVMVCTPEVCGQTGPGSWLEIAIQNGVLPPGVTLVLQTLQDPVEAANSPNGVGNVAGYSSGATYDHASGQWLLQGSNGVVYSIPLAYPGGESGSPVCVRNCDQLTVSKGQGDEGTADLRDPNTQEPGSSPSPIVSATLSDSGTLMARSTQFMSDRKLQVVASKGKLRKIWKVQANSNGVLKMRIPKQYQSWNLSITSGGKTLHRLPAGR